MPSDSTLELYRQHRTAQDKYVYFLLAAAGAAIALVVGETKGAGLHLSQLPLAGAVVLWSLSFYSGCRQLVCVELTLFANIGLAQVQEGVHPEVGRNQELAQLAAEGIRTAIEQHSSRAGRYGRGQFILFVLGALSYLIWHVYGMCMRTTPIPTLCQ